jgi:hypothetical protein
MTRSVASLAPTTLHVLPQQTNVRPSFDIGIPRKACFDGQQKGRKAELVMENLGAQHDRALVHWK